MVPWWLIALVAVAFGALALLAHGEDTLAIDRWCTRWLQRWDVPLARQLATLGDALGYSVAALALMTVMWVAFPLMRWRRELWFLAIVVVLRLAATLLKELFDSPRPAPGPRVEIVGSFDGLGFPSGHATTSAVMFGAITFIVARRVPRRDMVAASLVMWVVAMLLTDYARIWQGAHWLTDTLGGNLVGVLIILVAANLSGLIAREESTVPGTPPAQMPARQSPGSAPPSR